MSAHVDACELAAALARLVAAITSADEYRAAILPPAIAHAQNIGAAYDAQEEAARNACEDRRAALAACDDDARRYAIANPDKMKRNPREIRDVRRAASRCVYQLKRAAQLDEKGDARGAAIARDSAAHLAHVAEKDCRRAYEKASPR